MGVIVDVLWAQAEVRRGLLVALALAVLAAAIAWRRGQPWFVYFGLTLSAGVVLAVTLSGVVLNPGPGFAQWSQCRLEGPAESMSELRTQQGLANMALFVPGGLFATALQGRLRAGLVVGLLLSLVVELVQGATWGRDCSSVDVLANVIGAVGGAAAARAGSALRRGRGAECAPPPAAGQP